jgi:phosphoribosylformimino-5-aminoimidazole carboxamide ribotide isomerase
VEIIPAVDIRGGQCVRLEQGDYARETVFGVDPVAMALHWAGQGASRLHVVDLDAARDGRPVNEGVVRRIVAEAGIPVQVAGGVRDHGAIHRWAEAGAGRIVIGTLAIERPDEVDRALARHGDKIAVSIDARDGKPAMRGWVQTADMTAFDFIRDMARRGVRRFIYTDVDRDGTLQHPDFGELAEAAAIVGREAARDGDAPIPLIVGGGIASVEDIVRLADLGIEGVITGRALYDGRIDLRAARRALAIGDDW